MINVIACIMLRFRISKGKGIVFKITNWTRYAETLESCWEYWAMLTAAVRYKVTASTDWLWLAKD